MPPVPLDPPPGQKPCSKAHFARLSPQGQGYVSYMQAAWNPEIPEESPYEDGTREHLLWKAGRQRAMLDVQPGGQPAGAGRLRRYCGR